MPALADITRNPSPILPGTGGEIMTLPEAAAQSFKQGDIVTLSSGKVEIAIAAGSDLADDDDEILGVALHDASGTTDEDVKVQLINQQTILKLPVYHGTPGSAVTAVAQVGADYQLRHHTAATGWFVNIEEGSDPVAMVIGIAEDEPVGASYGYVFCRILQAELSLDA